MSRDHAYLSASASGRWIACPPSAKLQEQYADKGSETALEGTDAHALAEWKVGRLLGVNAPDPRPTLRFYDEDMDDYTDQYYSFIEEQLCNARQSCDDPLIMVEQRVDFSRWVTDGFGTADCIIVADGHLTIVDLKYGQSVQVGAEENPQMSCYALGAIDMLDDLYDIKDVTMVIFQPRRQNLSMWTTGKNELLQWADNVLSPAAELAAAGEGKFQPGSHCKFCRARHECRARAEEQMRLMRYDFEQPATLTDAEIEDILGQIDRLTAWAEEVREYAQTEAINGKKWTGYKLVESKTNRRYTDEVAVANAVIQAGKDPYERKLRGITDMTRLLGKPTFERILGGFVEKPRGKATLVPESDNRPAIDFNDLKKGE